jgi:23S rRNA pseudouridine2605 synthase
MQIRLQKILSTAGVASRRAAEELILEGRVGVNGEIVRTVGARPIPKRMRSRRPASASPSGRATSCSTSHAAMSPHAATLKDAVP